MRRFTFVMRQSIPSYLVAMVVGNLVSAEIGPRLATSPRPLLSSRRCVGHSSPSHHDPKPFSPPSHALFGALLIITADRGSGPSR